MRSGAARAPGGARGLRVIHSLLEPTQGQVPDMDERVERWLSARRVELARAIEELPPGAGADRPERTGAQSTAELTRLFVDAVRLLQPSIFCDVGAHDGA